MDQGQIDVGLQLDGEDNNPQIDLGLPLHGEDNDPPGEYEDEYSGNKPRRLTYPTDLTQLDADKQENALLERRIRTLARAKGLQATSRNLWKVAFEDFSERRTKHENRKYKRQEKMRSVKNEIYQVVGFFSAFQGLLITAAAQSILLRCNNVGFLLALSAFATALAVFGICQKIMAMEKLRFTTNSARSKKKQLKKWLEYLRDSGLKFDFRTFRKLPSNYRRTTWTKILVSYGTCLAVSVIAFGGLCMVAMRQIVCNPGHSLPSN